MFMSVAVSHLKVSAHTKGLMNLKWKELGFHVSFHLV